VIDIVSDTRDRGSEPPTRVGDAGKRPRDEDGKARGAGSLERDQPIFLPIDTLRHR